jgi:hypothetical protein
MDAQAEAQGPSWARTDWPPQPADDWTNALTGEWPAAQAEVKEAGKKIKEKAAEKGVEITDVQVQRAVLDSIRALMLIRAYRIRGHLVADLDPLGMRDQTPHPELDPKSYGFTEADMDRPIFLDNVLGLQHASIRQILDIVKRTYCGTFALQYMHISDPEQAAWLKERIEGYGKEVSLHPRGAEGDPEQDGRGRGLREVPACQVHGHQALRPRWRRKPDPRDGADHQARRRAGREGGRVRHAAPGPPVGSGQRDAEALSRDLQRVSRAGRSSPRTWMARAT